MKQKTHKATAKRIKKSGSSKSTSMQFRKASRNHILKNKSKRAKRAKYLSFPKAFVKQLSKLLPNG
jgi:ribosomal protein L35